MKIANFSVDRPVAITMLIIALVILGMVSLPKLAVDLYPDMEFPVMLVATSYDGADPAEVEKVVSKPMESAVGTVSNIESVRSVSLPGTSLVIVLFNWGTDIDDAAMEVRDKIDMFREMLPEGVRSPMIMKMDPNSAPIMVYTLSGTDTIKLNSLAENIVEPRLTRVDGIASTQVMGGREQEFKVVLDQSKVEAYGLTTGQVAQAVMAENLSGSVGTVDHGANEISIKLHGEYTSVDDLHNVQIPLGLGGNIKLSDIAEIKDDYKKITEYSYVDGEPAMSLILFKASGNNTVQVARHVKDEVEQLNQSLPAGVKLTSVLDTSKFIEDSVNNVVHHAAIGGMLAIIVMYLFLNSVRSTFVVVVVMPIAVIATFTMMYFSDQTINMLSLGGLALGLGSLIDFSVVVLESIYRYRQNGYGAIEAAKLGTAEVGNAVMASGMAQVVVFAPIVFVQGLAGILFGPLALTVSISHIAALFTALTLVPMMSSKLLKEVPATEARLGSEKTKNPVVLFGRYFARLSEKYGRMLGWALGHRKTVVILSIVLVVVSLALLPLVGTEFIPAMDQGEVAVDIELPSGTTLAETKVVANQVEEIIKKQFPDQQRIYTQVGTGDMAWLGAVGSNEASVQVKLVPSTEREYSLEDAMEKIRTATANIAGATITVRDANQQSMGSGKPVEITISGDDLEVLKELGALITDAVADIDGTRNVTNTLEESRPEVTVHVDREQAALYGLSQQQIMSTVRTAFDGMVIGKVRTGDDEIDIRMMYADDFEETMPQLENLMLTSASGAKVPLGAVAEIAIGEAPVSINRIDQARTVQVQADISDRDLGSVNKDIEALLKGMALPDGYTYEIGGQAKDMAESFGDLLLAMLLAVVLIYMVMAAQFESLFHPFIIMFSLPPTIVGVVFGMLVTGNRLSVPALIGVIMLIGIVVNNAIVLIDYVNTLRRRGLERNEAILQAGPVRLRPILMTTITTVLALLPMAFGSGDGAESWKPLAVVVTFGLTLSTLVTLLLVPVVYTLFDDLGKKIVVWLTSFKLFKRA